MSTDGHSLDVLRQFDRDRYFASLLLPTSYRDDIIALYAFSAEIARVRDVVSEPIPGEIRLQWWRDAIANQSLDAKANPLANHLLDVIGRHDLPVEAFDKMLLARAFDLYDDPMPTIADFEVYAGETTSLLFRQVALVAGAEQSRALADCCGHAGVAYVSTQVLRDFAKHVSQGRLLLPTELLAECGASREEILKGEGREALKSALLKMAERAEDHKRQAIEKLDDLPSSVRPAFNLLALIEPYLKQVMKSDFNPFEHPVQLSQLRRQWKLWRWK